jgi:hypothetical protein
MKIFIKIFEIIRRLYKSIGKKEKKILRLINYLNWKNRNDNFDLNFNQENINNEKSFFVKENLWPKKISACIAFSYKEDRLDFLAQICRNLEKINKNTDVTIAVNDLALSKKDLITKKISEKSSLNINFFCPQNLSDPRLLPFSHYEIVKEKIKENEFSHFLYLEDDILINEKNIKYWMIARQALKKYKLIPSFLRIEINSANQKKYLVDTQKKNNFFLQPKIFNKIKDFAFVNLINFYSGVYFYDRELMLEHLNGVSNSLDFGHGSYNSKWIIPEMQELGLLERASAGLAYKDVPKGFLHRNVVPVDVKKKLIKDYCLIDHLSNKYVNEETEFASIKVSDIFK